MAMLPPDPVYIFKGDMGPISCLIYKITSYIEYIYAGTQAGKVHIWNLKNNREIDHFESGKEGCLSLSISTEDENIIIVQDKVGVIRFWSNEDDEWQCVKEINTDYYGFCKCFIFNDNLYTPLKEGCIQAISLKSKLAVDTYNFTENEKLGEIMAFKIITIQNKNYFLIAFESGHICLWDFDEKLKVTSIKLEDCPMAIDFDTMLMKGVCGNPSDKTVVFVLDKSLNFHIKKYVRLKNAGVAAVAIRPDSKIVALGCWDGKLRLYSWKNLAVLAVLDTHSSTVQDIAFSRSNSSRYLLAAASKDGKISHWDLYN